MAPPAPAALTALAAEIEVLVLAEFIRHPRAAPEQLATKVSTKAGLRIQAYQVRVVSLISEIVFRHLVQPTSENDTGGCNPAGFLLYG